jgi:hypothetical protein
MENKALLGARKKSWIELEDDDEISDDGATSPLLSEVESKAITASSMQASKKSAMSRLSTSEKPPIIGYSLLQQLLQIFFQCFVLAASRLRIYKTDGLLLCQNDDADEEDHEVECSDYMNADYFHPGSIVGGNSSNNLTPHVDLKEESLQVLTHAPMILSIEMMSQLEACCFEHGSFTVTGLKRWKRLYSVARDGDSFASFLNHVQNEKHTVLVVKPMIGDTVLGAYVDTEWRSGGGGIAASETSLLPRGLASSLSPRFYGTSYSFLFSFNPKLSVFKWTGRNNYNQLCAGGRIALGGGGQEANFGLCIEDCFRKGSSGHCETYNNLPLAGVDNEFFDILAFEVYGFENPW